MGEVLELVANTQSDTANPKTGGVECNSRISTYNTDVRTPIKRQLEGEPEVILDTDVAYSTYIPSRIREAIDTCAGTDTHVPMPFTLLIPRNRSIERINPIISTRCTNTCESGEAYSKVNHVRLTKAMLIAEIATISKVYTDSTRLSNCKRNTCYGHNSQK